MVTSVILLPARIVSNVSANVVGVLSLYGLSSFLMIVQDTTSPQVKGAKLESSWLYASS